jgi:hypothetical protein
MSEIRATTISDAAGTGPITLTGQSAAKAWIDFNGTGTVAIRDSFNTSSLTDNSGGDYTVSFVTSFTNALFPMSGSCSYASGLWQPSVGSNHGTAKTASSQNILVVYSSSVTDTPWIELSWHGDLA